MSVEVVPSQLGFQRPLTQLVKRTLTVINPNAQPVAFKVKTTAPKQYCVRPNSGRIEPGERVEVSVLLQPMKDDPEPGAKCRDKFLVQSTIITPERESRPFTELWSLVEKEDKSSIAEHKIRCVYLASSSEDVHPDQLPLKHASNYPSNNSSSLNNHTNRDEDDDPRYNSVRSHPTPGFHGSPGSPLDRSTAELPDNTVYDMALDDTFNGRSTRPSTSTPSIAVLKARTSHGSHLSPQQDEKKTESNHTSSPRPPSSNLSNSVGGRAPMTNSTGAPGSPEEAPKLRAQLASALAEVERLKRLLGGQEEGLRKRTHGHDATKAVHSADMMSLDKHGLKGPEGLVPVQTVVLISIGVFVFTWLFF